MAEQVLRVYADTSVFGGVFDREFATQSKRFVDQVRQGRFRLVVSPLVRNELRRAPEHVREVWRDLLGDAESVQISAEAVRLQAAYLAAGIVGPAYSDDALHVAIATVTGCSAIVSWNFRHHVHMDKIPLYNEVNRAHGYGDLAIHSPSEVVEYDDEA